MAGMDSVFSIIIPIAVLATFAVLVVGIVSMLRGGSFNAKYSNKLMRMRVLAQLIAVLLIAAFFLLSRH
jgi:Hypoxia induced protein conserved region